MAQNCKCSRHWSVIATLLLLKWINSSLTLIYRADRIVAEPTGVLNSDFSLLIITRGGKLLFFKYKSYSRNLLWKYVSVYYQYCTHQRVTTARYRVTSGCRGWSRAAGPRASAMRCTPPVLSRSTCIRYVMTSNHCCAASVKYRSNRQVKN